MQAFSSCFGQWLLSVCGVPAPHRGGSRCGARALDGWVSVAAAHGLWSTGWVIVACGLSCSAACGIFPDGGWNPCPPALQSRFLTPGLPGKPKTNSLIIAFYFGFHQLCSSSLAHFPNLAIFFFGLIFTFPGTNHFQSVLSPYF